MDIASKTYREAYFKNRKFDSDKWDHYFEIYDHLLKPFYGTNITYVEIGVQNGGSLEVAKNLFGSHSKIVGLDVDSSCKTLESSGVASHIVIGSQVDEKTLSELISLAPEIDVLIDDGSHIQSHMIATFINLFPHLKENGVYIIEDTHTNYSPDHQDSFYGIGLYDYFKGLAERLNIDFIDPDKRKNRFKIPREERTPIVTSRDIVQRIFSIEFFDSVIAIRKKTKLEPLRIRR
jgi:hypothetical protein